MVANSAAAVVLDGKCLCVGGCCCINAQVGGQHSLPARAGLPRESSAESMVAESGSSNDGNALPGQPGSLLPLVAQGGWMIKLLVASAAASGSR
eukprot:CAMPEP_0195087202 /NCGR_PEP_ID=MMETSP0448-20130528/27115_1 /TAXON_ID=66468 /ORGANISM="Heterocapsa triquestra, Strain CCMP 448" /LENGTH=93 /DNA_ID=CAMNT_0040120743 /DNA_START=126 /DNA_END=403 /DNA_ORIENTATION=-